MRYIIFFNEDGKCEGTLHFIGVMIDPNEEIKRITHPRFKRLSEQMIIDLCGEEDLNNKIRFIELNEDGTLRFNQVCYDRNKTIPLE